MNIRYSRAMMVSIDLLDKYVQVIAGFAEIIIVFLLWKTVKDFSETARVSKIQVQHRFRPWVGPSSGIEYMRPSNGAHQYSVAIKNYGEIPASSVKATSIIRNEIPTRDSLKDNGKIITSFNLGPLLPLMEKRYWLFIDQKLKQDNDIFVAIYFEYEYPGGKSGYGMISELDKKANNFIHKDMWIE